MQFNTGERQPIYITFYFLSLALLAVSLPLSKYTMSLFQFSTLFFWLWHGADTGFLRKYNKPRRYSPATLLWFLYDVIKAAFVALIKKFILFFRNKAAMAIASLLLLHVIGLLYTTDFNYALKDLRTKLPIFILPLFIATGPKLSTRVFYLIMICFIVAVFGGSIYRLILFLNLPVADPRAITAHTSHIRYSLNAVFAIFIIIFFLKSKEMSIPGLKPVLLLIGAWLIAFMVYMNYSTGILLLSFLSIVLLIYHILKIKSVALQITALAGVAVLLVLPVVYIGTIIFQYQNTPAVEFSKLDKYTPYGNSYYHDTVNFKLKSGKWAGLYICEKELRKAWTDRSTKPLDSLDNNKQILRFTLISYLASKDLRKDADGMNQLTDEDINNIEQGINRYDYNNLQGVRSQIEDFITGYQHYIEKNDPNSGSMVQRFEYWRTSVMLIKQNPLLGVGTGDLPDAFEKQYKSMNSNLSSQNRLRSHNQYLSITVALGIVGLIWFLIVMFYPGIKTRNFNNYFYLIFWIIIMVSMLAEDTIESQEGVTFYVLFTALMLLGREKTEKEEELLA